MKNTLSPNRALAKLLASWLAGTFLTAVLLFSSAGRLDWTLGWLFIAAWSLLKLVFVLHLRWHDPDLLVERVTCHENTKPYDRIIIPIYFVLAFGTIMVAGLDGERFHWSGKLPINIIILSYLIYLFGNGLASWAVNSNPFFSAESRLQFERQHKVTDTGPYHFVRHPAYLAAILLWPVTGAMRGSWWAAIPGLLTAFMMFIRTVYEDRMLQKELPGYKEYSIQVRYRLFPGVW